MHIYHRSRVRRDAAVVCGKHRDHGEIINPECLPQPQSRGKPHAASGSSIKMRCSLQKINDSHLTYFACRSIVS